MGVLSVYYSNIKNLGPFFKSHLTSIIIAIEFFRNLLQGEHNGTGNEGEVDVDNGKNVEPHPNHTGWSL